MAIKKDIYKWCSVSVDELCTHPDRRVPLKLVATAEELGECMARDFAEDIKKAGGRKYATIVPCGPKEWYAPFARIINDENISLKNVEIFHMDECLDWEGKLLPSGDPNNFREFMDINFYGGIKEELAIKKENRNYLIPDNLRELSEKIENTAIDYTLGGLGQDGHVAFNQAKRSPYSPVTLDELRNSTARIQEANWDSIIALSQRSLGSAWQFIPPMIVTLGVKECLKAKKVRIYSATGAWKQTALRVVLFSEPDVEYPATLLSEHPDVCITVTRETAKHPISEHPEWKFRGVNI